MVKIKKTINKKLICNIFFFYLKKRNYTNKLVFSTILRKNKKILTLMTIFCFNLSKKPHSAVKTKKTLFITIN
jgi:hypothetical protein